MNKEVAEKVVAMNKETYEKIGTCFSSTREYLWKDFEVFKKYVKPLDNVIDLGCGNGRASLLFEENNSSYTGIDGSSTLIHEAHKKFPNAQFLNIDLLEVSQHVELFNMQYDVVCLFAVLNHFPLHKHRETILRDAYRLLKQGGFLFMTNWNLWNITSKKNTWSSWKERLVLGNDQWNEKYGMPKSSFGFRDIPTIWKSGDFFGELYYYSFRMSQLASMLRRTGFKVCEARYIKKDTHAHWWNGANSAIIAQKL